VRECPSTNAALSSAEKEADDREAASRNMKPRATRGDERLASPGQPREHHQARTGIAQATDTPDAKV